jgi:hypothetical protein
MLPLYGFRFGAALFLYPFRFVDPVTGRWVRARYRAERHEIAARYATWEIVGEPEVRRAGAAAFSPWR